MAEKRRAGLAGPQGKTKSRKMVEKVRLEETSSEDEAPEEVTFEDSKAAAVQRMKDALETARREKELLKERRRKRQALFQEQKNKRLLPDDVLDEIDSKVSRLLNCNVFLFSLKGGLVMRVCDQPMVDSQQQKARDFIQSCLYGKGTNRTTSKNNTEHTVFILMYINECTGLYSNNGYSSAVNATDEKAEKFKKQWMHKQKVVDS
uniref:Nucleolar protein 7 n=1 Tax=Scleropages formosus TaxID=113540 RepID=A0A8C9S7U9_SCLFO